MTKRVLLKRIGDDKRILSGDGSEKADRQSAVCVQRYFVRVC